ncbi:hypothetical protein WN50_33220 [Limnoraphis robusta CS-951]|uniref:Uncharacterized protein n=1 Tax=Limnoraphis robusta CS-951 TaxID=1637645 RepID=A0A0J9HNE6_9CYAN|nr:hypothetical protein WN50_33220 [Limnoraphis robusta CS-951]
MSGRGRLQTENIGYLYFASMGNLEIFQSIFLLLWVSWQNNHHVLPKSNIRIENGSILGRHRANFPGLPPKLE